MKTKRMRITSLLLAFAMLLSTAFTTTAFAAEPEETVVEEVTTVQPRSGANELLPYGERYEIGGFTFTDTNLTPVKIVQGTNLKLGINFRKADRDAGLGNVKLTVHVRDANTGAVISDNYYEYAVEGSNKWLTTPKINLGYAGRRVQIWFDASSAGSSNGNYRSITVNEFKSYVY